MIRRLLQAVLSLIGMVGVAALVAFVGGVILSGRAHGATEINCLPSTKLISNANGTKLRTAKSDTGRWFAWWCGAPDLANPPQWNWKLQSYAVIKELGVQLEAAIDKNGGDVESFDVLNALLTMQYVKPTPGSQEEYRWKMLRWSACQALSTKPYDVPNVITDLPADFCKAAPTPPAPSTDWTASGGTIFTYATGHLTGVTTRKATKGALCDDRSIAIVGATIYRSLVGGPATEVTACTKP